jgi:electron transport complex protein RnfG
MPAPEAGPLRMLGTLGTAGFCSGLALVGIFLATAPRIERNRAEALEAAIYRVLPGAQTRKAFVVREGTLTPFEMPGNALPQEEAVYAGYDAEGTPIGFAIPAEGPGFQDIIKLIYGYDPSRRRVVGMEVLESKETPGLGDKIIKDLEFVGNFRDLAVDPQLVAVKKGRTHENEVDAISGATISSNAVVRIINESNARWLERLPEPASAPPPGASPSAEAVPRARSVGDTEGPG